MTDRFLQMLGIAAKAGKVVSGSFSAEKAIKERKACLVIVSAEASENTKKHFSDMCAYRNIPIIFHARGAELGKSIGKKDRICAAVTDQGLSDKLISVLQEVAI